MTDGYRELPLPSSTSAERLAALQESKQLIQAQGMSGAFGAVVDGGGAIMSMMRLAEYITVGHDYLDTHPQEPETLYAIEDEAQRLEGNDDDRIDN